MKKNLRFPFLAFTAVYLAGALIAAQEFQQDISSKAVGEASRAVSLNQINNVARHLIAPCCWKQTVDVHPSESSNKIKIEIETALKSGQTEEQIINRFVAEYGERIQAIPKASGFNLMLWALPALILLAGSFVVVMILRHISYQRAGEYDLVQPPIGDSDLRRVEQELEKFDA